MDDLKRKVHTASGGKIPPALLKFSYQLGTMTKHLTDGSVSIVSTVEDRDGDQVMPYVRLVLAVAGDAGSVRCCR